MSKDLKSRAEGYAHSYPFAKVSDAYIAGAKEEYLLLTHWNNIEADKDGFTTNKAYAEIAASVPILVKDVIWGELFVVDKNNMVDWSGDLQHHPNQYKWRKIHE
jgi:hypothetical protein